MKHRKNNNNDLEQQRINRINMLLDRLDRIPAELDRIHDKLFNPSKYTRDEYVALITRRNNLLVEQDRVERELKETYKMKI